MGQLKKISYVATKIENPRAATKAGRAKLKKRKNVKMVTTAH